MNALAEFLNEMSQHDFENIFSVDGAQYNKLCEDALIEFVALRETAERRLELLGRLLDKPMNFSRRTITMTIPPDLARALAEELKQQSISADAKMGGKTRFNDHRDEIEHSEAV